MPYSIAPTYEELQQTKKHPIAVALEAAMQGKMAYNQAQEFKAKQEAQRQEAYFAYRKAGLSQSESWNRANMGGPAPMGEDTISMEKKKADLETQKTQAELGKLAAETGKLNTESDWKKKLMSGDKNAAPHRVWLDAAGNEVEPGTANAIEHTVTTGANGIPKYVEVKDSSDMQKKLTELDDAIVTTKALLDKGDEFIPVFKDDKIPLLPQGPENLVRGTGRAIAGAFQFDEKAKTWGKEKKLFLGNLARGLGGERGVLTDRDIDRIDKALPDNIDTEFIRNEGRAIIMGILAEKRGNLVKKMRGSIAQQGEEKPATKDDPLGIL